MKKLIILALAATMFAACGKKAEEDGFAWNKATVYFVLVDRFCNGDSTNDQQYGRCTDYGSERMNASTFHGVTMVTTRWTIPRWTRTSVRLRNTVR